MRQLSRFQIWLPLLLAFTLIAGLLIGMRLQGESPVALRSGDSVVGGRSYGAGRVDEVLRYIDAKYVDAAPLDELTEKAIRSLLDDLDPHSNYISVRDIAAIQEQLDGEFDGIGIEFMLLDDTITVVAPLSGGPSETAGILAGDKIVRINDSIVAGPQVNTAEVVGMLRGKKGTKVNVKVQRSGRKELLPFTIERDAIPVFSLDAAYMLDEQTGYIKINRFSAGTGQEFVEALEKLMNQGGAKNIVLDLRHNPGGYLQQAVRMLSQLFPQKGELLVYTEGRGTKRAEYTTSGRAFFDIDKIAILIDEGSASASEIVAGAVQDHDRGLIIGRRSFGKGLVQEQFPLSDGAGLRLTVARYYTPSGRSIQKPYDDYDADVDERYYSGELTGDAAAAGTVDSTQVYYTDRGHPVYGGGGIQPDVYVPIDSVQLDTNLIRLRGEVPGFAIRYLQTGSQLTPERYDLAGFRDRFVISDAILSQFYAYAREHGSTISGPLRPAARDQLARFIKARLAKQLYGDDAMYELLNANDPSVQRAKQLLAQPDPLAARVNEKEDARDNN